MIWVRDGLITIPTYSHYSPCIRFSESRILTLGHPHKHCRISLVNELGSDKSIDSASQTNLYRSFPTLRFCVTPIRSFVDKIVTSSKVFPSARMCLLLGRSWGLWVMAHLITCNPWTYPRPTDHYPNIQLPGMLKSFNCTVFLPSIGTKLGHDYSDSSWSFHWSIFPTSHLLYIQ